MTIRMIDTGEIMDVEDGWGARLIEQGKAVLAIKEAKKKNAKPKKDVAADEPENKD